MVRLSGNKKIFSIIILIVGDVVCILHRGDGDLLDLRVRAPRHHLPHPCRPPAPHRNCPSSDSSNRSINCAVSSKKVCAAVSTVCVSKSDEGSRFKNSQKTFLFLLKIY